MPRAVVLTIVVFSLLSPFAAVAREPARSGLPEGEDASLFLVETLALDAKRRTVADLEAGDFSVTVAGKPVAIETFELRCPGGVMDDPQLRKKDGPPPPPSAPGTPRKIVLAVDYHYLAAAHRPGVIDAIASMVETSKGRAEEIMLVALADGVRVEQRFTSDEDAILEAVRRMEHDVTLSARDYRVGASGKRYLESISTLMDVAGAHDGAKIVVLFSTLLTTRDQDERWFQDVAARAAAARTAIYPNWALGLQYGTARHDARMLHRFAAETGGRPPIATSDLSVQYRRAQRDLSCRYLLGLRLDDDAALGPLPLRIRVGRSGVILLYPVLVRQWTEEQTQESRLRAGFADPRPGERPLVRFHSFPMRPVDRQWDTLLTLQFSMPTASEETTLQMTASLERGGKEVEQYQAPVVVPAAAGGGAGVHPVTVTGDGSLKPGTYELKLSLAQPDGGAVVSRATRFEVPEVPKRGLFVKGPLLANAKPDGLLIRGDRGDEPDDTSLDEVLGGKGFQPLLVNRLDRSDGLAAYWEVCLAGGKDLPPEGSVVRRRFLTRDGVEAHQLAPVPFEIAAKGSVRCMHALDEIPAYTLRPGEFKLEVALEKAGGETLQSSSVPLKVD